MNDRRGLERTLKQEQAHDERIRILRRSVRSVVRVQRLAVSAVFKVHVQPF